MDRRLVDQLDARQTYWVPAVVAPHRDWSAAPGCRTGARFMVNALTLRPTRDEIETFETRLSCLEWIMEHRCELSRTLPEAQVRPVSLARWLLGLE